MQSVPKQASDLGPAKTGPTKLDVTSATPVEVFRESVGGHVDYVLFAIANKYAGADPVSELTFTVYAKFDWLGDFFEIHNFKVSDGCWANPVPMKGGDGFWGVIGPFHVEQIKVMASRTGADDVPIHIETVHMAQEFYL